LRGERVSAMLFRPSPPEPAVCSGGALGLQVGLLHGPASPAARARHRCRLRAAGDESPARGCQGHPRRVAALTLVLLDTNTCLRLAKRIRPLLGVKFGQKD